MSQYDRPLGAGRVLGPSLTAGEMSCPVCLLPIPGSCTFAAVFRSVHQDHTQIMYERLLLQALEPYVSDSRRRSICPGKGSSGSTHSLYMGEKQRCSVCIDSI